MSVIELGHKPRAPLSPSGYSQGKNREMPAHFTLPGSERNRQSWLSEKTILTCLTFQRRTLCCCETGRLKSASPPHSPLPTRWFPAFLEHRISFCSSKVSGLFPSIVVKVSVVSCLQNLLPAFPPFLPSRSLVTSEHFQEPCQLMPVAQIPYFCLSVWNRLMSATSRKGPFPDP